jgi:hypothetical protein
MPGHRPASARRGRGRGPAAPKARRGFDDNTGTLAPASPACPACPVEFARGPRDGDPRRYGPEFPGDDRPRGHLGGQEHPLPRPGATTGRRPGARTTSPVRGARAGGPGYRRYGVVSLATARLIFACRRHQPATGTGRTDRRPGRPIPFRRWHRIRAGLRIAEPRPPGRLGARGPAPGGVGPGRQRAVP